MAGLLSLARKGRPRASAEAKLEGAFVNTTNGNG